LGASLSRMQSRALVGTALLGGRRVVMAKPQTYMNLSGQPVSSLLRFYQVPMDNLMVVHDDLDIPFGRLRLRREGGSGGARGMADIITRLGTTDFARLRIGIGRPEGGRDAAGYVLDDFSRSEQELLPQVLASVCEALRLFILEGIESAMNRYNGPVLKE